MAQTIDEVIAELDEIVRWSEVHNSRMGYFAVLYRDVTKEVKNGIRSGRFSNGERMETLDVIFANRYLEAFEQYRRGETPSTVWKLAFDAAKRKRLTVLQHLMLGMNAHINLDLGIAATETVPTEELPKLEGDFVEINQLLIEMVDQIQDRLSTIAPAMRIFDKLAGRLDEKFAAWSMRGFRDGAWKFALKLSETADQARESCIADRDESTNRMGKLIAKPPGISTRLVLKSLQMMEKGDPSKIIVAMKG